MCLVRIPAVVKTMVGTGTGTAHPRRRVGSVAVEVFDLLPRHVQVVFGDWDDQVGVVGECFAHAGEVLVPACVR